MVIFKAHQPYAGYRTWRSPHPHPTPSPKGLGTEWEKTLGLPTWPKVPFPSHRFSKHKAR